MSVDDRAARERRLARDAIDRARRDRHLADAVEGWRRELYLRSHHLNLQAAKLHTDLARMAEAREEGFRPRPRVVCPTGDPIIEPPQSPCER
jgi:hypothetical protein